jgi:flagellar motor protein MotB/tetratricopeptide (TPR) repeat protein
MRYILTIVIALFTIFNGVDSYSQKKELKKARRFYQEEEYYLCLDMYGQAEEKGATLSLEDKLIQARCYYALKDVTKAWEMYTELSLNLTGDDVFYYASSQHQNGAYEDAISWYEKAKLQQLTISINSYQINELIRSCKWALNNQTFGPLVCNPEWTLASMGQSFGVQYYKRDHVVYSSAQAGGTNFDKTGRQFLNLYISDLGEDRLPIEGSQRIFSQNLISPYHVGAITFTSDFKYMYFTKTLYVEDEGEEKSIIKIFVVEFDGKDWVNERECTFNSNKFDCGHPALTPDDKYLFFVSNRSDDGYGEKDIYYCERKGANSFGPVKNLGSAINTYGDEVYPVISRDYKLYFSSDGHPGFGGLDIFVAEYIDGTWQNVRNVMQPLNSIKDDFCYVIDETDPEKGFISSNKLGKGGEDVINYVKKASAVETNPSDEEMPPVIGADVLVFGLEDLVSTEETAPEPIAEPETSAPAPVEEVKPHLFKTTITSTFDNSKIADAEFTLSDGSTGEVIVSGRSDANGQVTLSIPGKFANEDVDFNVSVKKEGFNEKTFLALLSELDALTKEGIALTPIFNDSVLDDISGMFIPYGTDFDAEGRETLDKLAAYLLANPNIVVKLNGHTEAKGNRYGNLNVSLKMAEKAKDYIVSKGVNPEQMICRGYGERYLKNRCYRGRYCDKAQHAENRRVEVVVWNVRK